MVKASIVIRTFNSQRTIRRVLQAVSAQSLDGYEVVIVDSGSTDGTLEIVREYPHVLVDYSGEEFTYSGSLNAGCAATRGEYVVCLSHHCIPLHRDWLAGLVEAMDSDGQLAGAWGPLLFHIEDYVVGRKDMEVMGIEEFNRRPNWGLQNPNSIIRRKLWEERPFSEDVERCEDQDWARHFLERGYRTAMVYGAQVLYTPNFSFYYYAVNNYKNALALDRMFGYRGWDVSVRELMRRSVRLLGATVLGSKSSITSKFAISSMMGRWVAGRALQYRDLSGATGRKVEDENVLRGKALAAGIRNKLRSIEGRSMLPRVLSGSNYHAPASQELKTRFFLVGEMRSGTSWLSSTLNAHPEVFCKGEGSFFGRDQETEEIPVYKGPTPSLHNALAGADGFRTWHSLAWNAWGRGDADEDLANITRLTIDYFLLKDSSATGKRIVGDKSPLHTDHADEIHRLYPDAKVIHIYRDGRDVAVSLMHHFWRLAKDKGGIFDLEPEELEKRDAYYADPEGFLASGSSIFTEERLRQMAVRWSRRVDKASRDGSYLFGPNYYQLSYEELLAEPEEKLKNMFELIGASADDSVISRCVEKTSFERQAKRSRGQSDAGSFFRKGIAGDWRTVFTAQDRALYEDIAGESLLKMGYPLG